MRIGIDIDGVLADFVTRFVCEANDIDPNVPRDYVPDGWDMPAIDREVFNKAWSKVLSTNGFWSSLFPFHKNVEDLVLFLISNPQVEVYYCTSRTPSDGPSLLEQCTAWLNHFNLIRRNTSIVCVGTGRSKWMVYEATECRMSLDDYHKNVRSIIKATASGFEHTPYLLDRPWNRNETDLDHCRVNSMQEFLDKVRREL